MAIVGPLVETIHPPSVAGLLRRTGESSLQGGLQWPYNAPTMGSCLISRNDLASLAMGLNAILITGPSGSGKTPLGRHLSLHGLCGRHCIHFDFGQVLRETASAECLPPFLTEKEHAVILHSLKTGALLEEEDFPIALKLLHQFTRQAELKESDLLLLNGLPRHLGQARILSGHLTVIGIIHLICNAETLRKRIEKNTGGDRAGRSDDSRELFMRKMAIFLERTLPLLDYYRTQGATLYNAQVSTHTSPETICQKLESEHWPGA